MPYGGDRGSRWGCGGVAVDAGGRHRWRPPDCGGGLVPARLHGEAANGSRPPVWLSASWRWHTCSAAPGCWPPSWPASCSRGRARGAARTHPRRAPVDHEGRAHRGLPRLRDVLPVDASLAAARRRWRPVRAVGPLSSPPARCPSRRPLDDPHRVDLVGVHRLVRPHGHTSIYYIAFAHRYDPTQYEQLFLIGSLAITVSVIGQASVAAVAVHAYRRSTNAEDNEGRGARGPRAASLIAPVHDQPAEPITAWRWSLDRTSMTTRRTTRDGLGVRRLEADSVVVQLAALATSLRPQSPAWSASRFTATGRRSSSRPSRRTRTAAGCTASAAWTAGTKRFRQRSYRWLG